MKYEAVFILDPALVEGNGEAFGKTIEEQIQNFGGTVTRVKFLDKKTFARPIGKHNAGIYWDYVAEMDTQAVAKLEDKYALNETVLRLCVFKYEDGQDDYVFGPRNERFYREASFEDYDQDERPYRGRNSK